MPVINCGSVSSPGACVSWLGRVCCCPTMLRAVPPCSSQEFWVFVCDGNNFVPKALCTIVYTTIVSKRICLGRVIVLVEYVLGIEQFDDQDQLTNICLHPQLPYLPIVILINSSSLQCQSGSEIIRDKKAPLIDQCICARQMMSSMGIVYCTCTV